MESLTHLRIIRYVNSLLIINIKANRYLTSTLQIGKIDLSELWLDTFLSKKTGTSTV